MRAYAKGKLKKAERLRAELLAANVNFVNKSGFKCPMPLINIENSPISTFKGKKLTILTFIHGKSKENLSNLTPHWLNVMLNYSHPPVIDRIIALRKFK